MTEEDAKEKWCPFARYVETNDDGTVASPAYNRDAAGHADNSLACNCIGSACMAWRIEKHIDVNDNTITHGYCGLAGRP